MYLSKDSINTLHKIISELNCLETESEQEVFLSQHVEDTNLLLQTLKSVNKKNLPKMKRNTQKFKEIAIPPHVYQEKEVRQIFEENDEKTLLGLYSLVELKSMYHAIYQKNPPAKSKKEDIFKILKNRFSTLDRAAAFAHLSAEFSYKSQ